MGQNRVEKVAYLFGWFLLGPLNVSLESVKKKFKKRSGSGTGSAKRLVVANIVGIVSLMMKFRDTEYPQRISDAANLISRAFKLDDTGLSSVESLFLQFRESSLNFCGLASTLPELIGRDQKSRNLVFELLVYTSDLIPGLKWEKKLLLMRIADNLKIPYSRRGVLIKSESVMQGQRDNCDRLMFYLSFLELPGNSSSRNLHARYRKIVKSIHPDLHPNEPDDVRQARIAAMQDLNTLYHFTLKNISRN